MKFNFIFLLLFIVVLMNCTKSIAIEEELPDKTYHFQKVGAAAHDLLSNNKYNALKIEVQHMPGYQPSDVALKNLKTFLYKYINKPGGITIVTKELQPAVDTIVSINEVVAFEKANRMEHNLSKELSLYILYYDGFFEDEKMLGYAYLNTSAVLFTKNLEQNTGGSKKPSRTVLETRVLQHEVAHLLGLVNVGTPLQSEHKDDDHGKHCINKHCLMYYLTDTEESPEILLKKGVPKLCWQCRNDLLANGGRR